MTILLTLMVFFAWGEESSFVSKESELARFPNEQVRIVRNVSVNLREMKNIIAGAGTEDEKAAAILNLKTCFVKLHRMLQGMSSHRVKEIRRALGHEGGSWERVQKEIMDGLPESSPLREAANETLNSLFNGGDDWEMQTEIETVEAILCCANELEKHLAAPNISRDTRLELLRLYYEKLVICSAPLFIGSDKGYAHARKVEQIFMGNPASVASLIHHLDFLHSRISSGDDGEMTEAEQTYENYVRRIVVYRLPELTADGRQELDRCRNFLQASDRIVLGRISWRIKDDENNYLLFEPCPEARKSIRVPSIIIRSLGSDEEYEAFDEAWKRHICLLRFNHSDFTRPRGSNILYRNAPDLRDMPSHLLSLPGGEYTLQRVFEKNPDLRPKLLQILQI